MPGAVASSGGSGERSWHGRADAGPREAPPGAAGVLCGRLSGDAVRTEEGRPADRQHPQRQAQPPRLCVNTFDGRRWASLYCFIVKPGISSSNA